MIWMDSQCALGRDFPQFPLYKQIESTGSKSMCDLLPEFWVTPRSEEEIASQKLTRSRGWQRTQEIRVGLQCFALCAAVAVKCPSRVPEMMAWLLS